MKKQQQILFDWKLRRSYFTSIISISLVLFLIGITGFIALITQQLSNYVRENIGFAVILQEQTEQAEILRLQKEIDASMYSKSTQYVTKEEAAYKLKQDLGEDFVDFLGYNPLLSSIEVQLNAAYANPDSIEKIESLLLENDFVNQIFYQENLIYKVSRNLSKISMIIFIFITLLLSISIVLINNTIRMSVYSKRFIINTMKLVGATERFIRRPYLLTAIFHGTLGAVIAIMLMMGVIQIIQHEFGEATISLSKIGLLFLGVILSGILINITATWLSVNRYLRMKTDDLYY